MPNAAESALRLENQLCFAVHSAAHGFAQAYKPLLEPIGLTYPQFLVLLCLWEKGNQSVSELGARLYLDSGTLTPMLKRMEKADLVTRRRDLVDERLVRIALTVKGEALREKAADIPIAMGCITGLGQEVADQLRTAMKALANNLRAAA